MNDADSPTPPEDTGSNSSPLSRRTSYGCKSPVYSETSARNLDPEHLKEMRCIGMFPEIPNTKYYKILKTQIHQLLKQR
jgi:hypothetical protein